MPTTATTMTGDSGEQVHRGHDVLRRRHEPAVGGGVALQPPVRRNAPNELRWSQCPTRVAIPVAAEVRDDGERPQPPVHAQEAAADRATAELAALTDEWQIADIRLGIDAALAGWRLWRNGPDYPPRGHAHRDLVDRLERIVGELGTAVRALPDDAEVRTVANLCRPLLTPTSRSGRPVADHSAPRSSCCGGWRSAGPPSSPTRVGRPS